MILKFLHASEAHEKCIKTQLTRLYFLEFLICRSRMELTICILTRMVLMLPVSAPHFENKGNCYQGWEKLTESEERKGTTGKIENHWKGREHSKDKIHTSPRNCPDCIYFTRLLPFPSLTVGFLSASSWALPVPADSIPLRLQGLVLRLLLYSNLLPSDLSPFAGFKFHMLMIPISSSDSKTHRSNCLPDVSLWWTTGISK